MAGVKGRSGGARPGAGRPSKQPQHLELSVHFEDPQAFLRAVMNDSGADAKLRVDAAKALMPYVHARLGETGKKDAKNAAAKDKAAAGRYAAAAPPLRAVK